MKIFIIVYVVISFFFAYILKNQLNIVNLISTKSDLKLRKKVVQKQEQIKLYIKLTPIWPVMIFKELYDEINEIKSRR